MRVINVAAAQMGPIQRAEGRDVVVRRMTAMMDEAKGRGADLIVYPELALTTFFPRWYIEDQAEVDTGRARVGTAVVDGKIGGGMPPLAVEVDRTDKLPPLMFRLS